MTQITENVGESPEAVRPRRGRWLTVLLAVTGVAALGAGGAGLGREFTRPATAAEIKMAAATEKALRWKAMPAEEIFPATLKSKGRTAQRAGILRSTDCAEAFEKSLAKAIQKHKCIAVLRATYVENGTHAVTVGIAVFPDAASAKTVSQEAGTSAGIRVAAFPESATGRYRDKGRQLSASMAEGSYAAFFTSGNTDGRKTHRDGGFPEDRSFAFGLRKGTGFAAGCSRCYHRRGGYLAGSAHDRKTLFAEERGRNHRRARGGPGYHGPWKRPLQVSRFQCRCCMGDVGGRACQVGLSQSSAWAGG